MTVEEIRRDVENFPMGLRVLAVDDDLCCLKLLENLLMKCQYHVTTTNQARVALKMLRENKDMFDLVISDVHMPDMDGFKLLELVGLEMDLPVIMLSVNGDRKLVMKGVTHGACDYLVKPIRIEELRNIWQHVVRRRKFDAKNQKEPSDQVNADQASGEDHGSPLAGNTDQNEKFNRKRKDEEDDIDENGNECEDPATQKKPRVVWSIELHRKFVGAVNQLGIEKAVPKRILDLMNVDGLTRENVASHLQKYRLYLKRISTVATQQANMVAALGVKDSPFMQMGSLDGLGDFRALAGARLANVGLSPYTSGGMLGRLNSPANVSLHNLSPLPLVQLSQAQNLTNSVASLRDMHLVHSPSSQNPSLLQGIPSLELDQLQQNKSPTGTPSSNTIDNSRMFRSAIGSSNNLLNSIRHNPVMLHGNAQSTHEMASFNVETFNAGSSNLLDPGRCNDNWPNSIESSKTHSRPLLVTEPFHSQLPLNGLRDDPIGLSSTMALQPFEDSREMQGQVGLMGDVQSMNGQGWGVRRQNYAHSSQMPANGVLSNLGQSLDQNNGFLNQKMEMLVSGRSNDNERQSRQRANEDFPLEQSKLQGGFVSQGYDSLDELVNAMIKREQDDAIPNCDYGFDDYSFGADL